MIKSAAFYAEAIAAVERYAREHALLPAFQDRRVRRYVAWSFGPSDRRPIARVLTCGGVDGDALPRAADTWLTLMPFEDIRPITRDETKQELLTKRARFMRLLARLADRSDLFPLHSGIDCVDESDNPALSFWLRLLRALAPDFEADATEDLERNLAALSHGRALRILISVESNVSQAGMAQSLEFFFNALAQDDDHSGDKAYMHALEVCGLTHRAPEGSRPVEVAIEFVCGKMSPAVMETILDGLERSQHSLTFRLCCLRFGPLYSLASHAAALLGERVRLLSLDTLQLGCTRDVRPLMLRQTLTAATTTVRRLVMGDRDCSINAIGSALRASGAASVQELDLECCATLGLAEWLAFAIFHVDSPAQISTLCLRFREGTGWLTPAWMDRFKAVLRGVVLPETHGTVRQSTPPPQVGRFVKVAAGTAIKFSPYEGKKTTTKLSDADAELEYEALDEEEEGGKRKLAIVVPGVGVGWVFAIAVQYSRAEPSQLRLSPDDTALLPIKRCVTSLALCGAPSSQPTASADHPHVLVDLLSIVGAPLKRLALPHMGLFNTHMTSVLGHCPNLTELNMSRNPHCDLSPIVDAYASGQLSKLTSLSMLQFLDITYQEAGAAGRQWTQWLTNGGFQHGTVRLRRVAIHGESPPLPEAESRAFLENQLVPLASCLQAIDAFEHVELDVPSHHRAQLAAAAAPPTEPRNVRLRLRNKLALLSVVQAKATHGESPMAQLDTLVLGLIFQFCRGSKVFILASKT